MKIDKDILVIIEEGFSEGSLYYLPKVQLDRSTYVKVNKVLEALGGKWNRKLKAHVFPETIEEAIDNVILTGEVVDLKKELQFFETPPELADKLVEMAEIEDEVLCLEPSAGKGNIVDALVRGGVKSENIQCYEINEDFVYILQSKGFKTVCSDFIQIQPNDVIYGLGYDRVVMNPPFTKQQDIDHVLHSLQFLNKGGILVSVMGAGVMFRTNQKTKNFWEIIYHMKSYEVEELPEKTFKTSGTNVNTIVLKVKKS